ncbi:MAG: UDP-2,3-diacylglucosamine diphosphatase LpxI [Myxococcota bacterium]
MPERLGLIAGDGSFPIEVAREARGRNRFVVAVAFRGVTDPALEAHVDRIHWLALGELGALLEVLRKGEVRVAVMAGKVPKTWLYAQGADRALDFRARALLAGLPDRSDQTILNALADLLSVEGVELCSQLDWASECLTDPGPLGGCRATLPQLADVEFGWHVAKALSAQEIGQTVVVRDRTVIAVEAIEGSDQAIRRGGELAGAGVCVVKVAKSAQDPRFDLPALGPGTLRAMVEARASVLAFEAAQTVVLKRDELVELANAHGIAVIAVGDDGPAALRSEMV